MEITPLVWFAIIAVSALIASIPIHIATESDRYFEDSLERMRFLTLMLTVEPFIVSEYCDRIEKTSLAILEEQKPVDQIIILWLGLDGLKLNEDGETEWISRKKPEPVNQSVFCQPAQSIMQSAYPHYSVFDMCQSVQSETITGLQMQNVSLQMQATQSAQNMAMYSALQSCAIPATYAYPSYLYSGTCGTGVYGTGWAGYLQYLQTPYLQQMQNYCCNKEEQQ